jgi:hypothetical protein
MKFLSRLLFVLLALALTAGIFWYVGFKSSIGKIQQSEDIELVMEKIQKVNKWTTVEAYFSEIYNYKDYYYYDFSPLRKKALIRVKAKVSAGFDFESINFETKEDEKLIIIHNFPKAEILSVDHELDYYDISEGTFNSFTPEEYNQLNKNAKDYILQKAMESQLLQEAEDNKSEWIEMIKWTIRSTGWDLLLKEEELLQ